MTLSLAALSDWLCALQAVFRAHGHAHMFVGGSSARALLDRSAAGLRDIDLFLDGAGRPDDELGRVAADLGAAGVVREGPAVPRAKLRANPALPLPARDRHAIGVGMHLFPRTAPLPIVSLTLLRGQGELLHNGIFDIDAIYVIVETRRPLLAQLEVPAVFDPFAGVAAWRTRRPRVIHWEEVARCHARHGLRIARTLAGCGRAVDADIRDRYRGLCPERPFAEPEEVIRDLVKLLADPTWRAALSLARELAVGADESHWLTAALARWDGAAGAAELPSVMARARVLTAADEALAAIGRAQSGVFPFVEGG